MFVEPADRVLGRARPVPHYVFRTQPEGARSGPGEVDLLLYSLREYLRPATVGNPTAQLPLPGRWTGTTTRTSAGAS